MWSLLYLYLSNYLIQIVYERETIFFPAVYFFQIYAVQVHKNCIL